MLGHHNVSPLLDTSKSMSGNGSSSPEVMRPNLSGPKARANQLHYAAPQESNANSYSPLTTASSGTYSASSNGAEGYVQPSAFKRSNSDSLSRGNEHMNIAPGNRNAQRHSSFGVADSKPVEFTRPQLQTSNSYNLVTTGPGNQSYQSTQASPQTYVSQQNFPPFSLPPPGFNTSVSTSAPIRESEPVYPTSMSTDYPSEIAGQQSGPDMMILDQMTAPNTMPVFGGEGYNRSPFAIPEDFVAYLFSGQQLDGTSPMGQIGQPGYAK